MAARTLTTGRTAPGLRLLCFLALSAAAAAGPFDPAPRFEGKTIPDPPMQGAPWAFPESKLPRFLNTATAALFEMGLADPRGCEYREVEVGDGFILKTHGFVLPEKPGHDGRFVVGWDGVVYPALSVGAAADLEADVRALAAILRASRGRPATGRMARDGSGTGFTGLTGPRFIAAGSTPNGPASVEGAALKLCLLLRLGRADLAETLFAAATTWTPEAPRPDLTDYHLNLQSLAVEWAHRVYNRAVDAHGRGDDAVSLDAARRVAAFSKAAEPRLDAMGFPRPPRNRRDGAEVSTYFPNLNQVADLLADQERRAKEPPREPIPGPDAPPEKRVAALIRELDEVHGQAIMNGIASPNQDATVTLLVGLGEPAVGPLLSVLESDNRLTRTVSYPGSRYGVDDRSISYVFEPADAALRGILKSHEIPGATGFLRTNDPAARKREAGALRAYWEKNRDVPLAERWYQTLADDSAGSRRWIEAAGGLAAPVNPPANRSTRYRHRPFSMPKVRIDPAKVPLRGDPVRAGKTPTVTALIVRRVDELSRVGEGPTPGNGVPMYAATELALILARWDADAARPVLAETFRRCRDEIKGVGGRRPTYSLGPVAADAAKLTEARADLGDPRALDDYAAFLRSVDPKAIEDNLMQVFAPMEDHPDHPAVKAAAEWVFNDPASPWLPFWIDPKHPNNWYHRERLLGGPLVGLAGFRTMLLRSLDDREAFGKVTVDADGSVGFQVAAGGGGGFGTAYVDRDGPKGPSESPLRVGDFVAWKLTAGLDGIPPCMPYWPPDRRDRAKAEQADFLRRYGDRFAESPLQDEIPYTPGASRYPPTFPPLDHPANGDDVRKGLAVFTLEGQGETRLVKLPERPLAATWVTLKDYAFRQQRFSMQTNKSEYVTAFDDEGLVWQAEEIREGDRWTRYYGFVGRRLGRVPAAEIEFPLYNLLSGGLECQVTLPPPPATADPLEDPHYEAGRPLTVTVRLRNRGGLDRSVPTEYVRDGPAFRRGVELKLSRGPKDAKPSFQGFGEEGFTALKPRDVARFTPGDSARTLGPAEAFDAIQIDLNTWFEIDRPGVYRLQAAFTGESGVAEGVSNPVIFRVSPAPRR